MGFRPEILAAVDTDGFALDVHKSNLGTRTTLGRSVSSIVDFHISGSGAEARFAFPPQIVARDFGSTASGVDLVVAGPPCEGHSNLNNRTRRSDPRNHLYLTAVALAIALDANAILVENVPHVQNDKRNVVGAANALLEKAGYVVTEANVRADELGAPQRRTRFFLTGIKAKISTENYIAPVLELLRAPATPLSWAIGDLVDRRSHDPVDQPPELSEENIARIEYLFRHKLYDLPDAERPLCHRNGTSYRAVYGRMHWDKPAHTITTGFSTPGRGRYIHPLRKRVITPHEAARIQGFPDWFSFAGAGSGTIPRKNLEKWIGDAVPPIMGYAMGIAICAALLDR
jgi:DNA (cytosine-5)-methyltransferase 1